jgi:aspartate/methionine/tyrosine aminotransferase
MAQYIGAKRVPLPLIEKNNFAFDPDQLESLITKKTRLVIINSPHNPTGSVLPRETVARLSELAVKHDFYVLSDEIYSRIIYDGENYSPYAYPGMPERTIILDGHSKAYAMTGWRLGYGVFPLEMAARVAKLQTNSTSCTCTFTQLAGVQFAIGLQCHETRQAIDEARADEFRLMCLELLGQIGVELHHLVVAEDRIRRCRSLAAAVGMHADIGGQHCPQCRHVAAT